MWADTAELAALNTAEREFSPYGPSHWAVLAVFAIGSTALVWIGRRQSESQARLLRRALAALTGAIYGAGLVYLSLRPDRGSPAKTMCPSSTNSAHAKPRKFCSLNLTTLIRPPLPADWPPVCQRLLMWNSMLERTVVIAEGDTARWVPSRPNGAHSVVDDNRRLTVASMSERARRSGEGHRSTEPKF
jgi:hypothetical protein